MDIGNAAFTLSAVFSLSGRSGVFSVFVLSLICRSGEKSRRISGVALHVKMLEVAGLINAEVQPGTRGAVKLCSRKRDTISIDLMDVAQILWGSCGYVEYRFPNRLPKNKTLQSISFTVEICSEAANYRENWKSEITLWINEIECGTFLSPGDFGARRGRYTPKIWASGSTQYGLLTCWSVRCDGCYINDNRVGDVTVEKLGIKPDKPIVLRIGNKEDAQYIGGFNLFGKKFGDYPQDLVMSLEY